LRGRFFATSRAKLREIGERLGVRRLVNLRGCPIRFEIDVRELVLPDANRPTITVSSDLAGCRFAVSIQKAIFVEQGHLAGEVSRRASVAGVK
jgi:hypothetical protein